MAKSDIPIFFEIGKKRTIASALDWPGWCRIGKDEDSAVQELFEYAPRYAKAVAFSGLNFTSPTDPSQFQAVERLEGNATTDYGAPDAIPSADLAPFDEQEYQRLTSILKSSWLAFDEASQKAQGKELRLGPRGGGRDLEGITNHVLGADGGYLSRLGRKAGKLDDLSQAEALQLTREAVLEAMLVGRNGELPKEGPRGGKIWPVRFYVRRAVWHTLDHAWEIEDRIV